jgi:hypothetical protein
MVIVVRAEATIHKALAQRLVNFAIAWQKLELLGDRLRCQELPRTNAAESNRSHLLRRGAASRSRCFAIFVSIHGCQDLST